MAHTTAQCLTNSQLDGRPRRAPAKTASSVVELMRLWLRRARERRDLARLDERELHDLGLSHSLIHNEINKPFWRG